MLRRLRVVALLLVSVLTSCTANPGSDAGPYVERDTLPNGTVFVRYSRLPEGRNASSSPELRLGAVEGDPNLVFGDVRSVDADGNGRIYVLDYLASEIRAFDATGAFLYKVAGRGEGPGEIGQANGMILVGDTILWVQDHSKWMMIGLSPEGEELNRVPMHVLSYGYVWEGTVDNADRIWELDSHFDQEDGYAPREGLNEMSVRLFLKSLDLATNAIDSVFLGDVTARTFVKQVGNGRWHLRIPFLPMRMSAVDPDGGFWQVHNAAYRVARLDEVGDTTMVLEVDVDPIRVEPAEREAFIDRISRDDPGQRRTAEEVAGYIPDTKPVIQRLITDDEGRLWVERTVRAGADPHYDIFNTDGEFQGSVELDFHPDEFRPIRIRHGHIYAVVLDDLDIPTIVKAKVPELVDGLGVGS